MYFTAHAIERFQQRWAPGFPLNACLRELCVLARTVRPLKARTRAGQEQWQVTDGAPIVLVCKRDRGRMELVCVTVLPEPEPDGADEGPDPDVDGHSSSIS